MIDEETEIQELTHCYPTKSLTQHPHYHSVSLGTLPPPSPHACLHTALAPLFRRRLAGVSAAGRHAPAVQGSCSPWGWQHLQSLWPSEEGPSSHLEPSRSSSMPSSPQSRAFHLLQNVQLLQWREPGCLRAWDQLLQILFCLPFPVHLVPSSWPRPVVCKSRCQAAPVPLRTQILGTILQGFLSLVSFRYRREAATLIKLYCVLFLTFSACLFLKIWEV